MINRLWRVQFTRAELPSPVSPLPFVADLPGGWDQWLAEAEVEAGTPFLLSPLLEYDVTLNGFFRQLLMTDAAKTTQAGYARDLAAFLSFLWSARERQSWRDATEADHLAYLVWRRRDPDGPRVTGATWDREVAAVNRFYRWAVRAGHVLANPIPQVSRRPTPLGMGRRGSRTWTSNGRPRTPMTWSGSGCNGFRRRSIDGGGTSVCGDSMQAGCLARGSGGGGPPVTRHSAT